MKIVNSSFLFVIFIMFCVATEQKVLNFAEKMSSSISSVREQAFRDEVGYRDNIIHESLKIAQQFTSTKGKFSAQQVNAVRLLGELRAEVAIPFLLEHIALTSGDDWAYDGGDICVTALIKIGSPVVDIILNEYLIKATDNQLSRYVTVLCGILGTENCEKLLNYKLKLLATLDAEKMIYQKILTYRIFKKPTWDSARERARKRQTEVNNK